MRSNRLLLALALGGVFLVQPTGALAAFTQTTPAANLGVSMTISAACTVSVGSVAFTAPGLINTGTAPASTGTVTVTCSNGTLYEVAMAAGGGSGANTTTRKMTKSGGTETISYRLCQDLACGTNWGNTTDTKTGTGTGSAVALTVYGQVPNQSTPSSGSYADTVAVTVNY